MNYTENLKRSSSCCFGGQLTKENLPLYKDYGIELWSIHLPFSKKLDISILDDDARNFIIETNLALIEEASKHGVKVAVLHPSSEPITDEDRPARLRRSKEAIITLRKQCDKFGMTLAVENLPRTCLCNRSAEMIELLKDTGASIVFDTNHSLVEDNVEFLAALANSGIKIASLHISDFDGIDERHRLPGEGINKWNELFAILEKVGYSGPMMYEVPKKPKTVENEYTYEMLKENQTKLANGEI